jgi:hypothetical protein
MGCNSDAQAATDARRRSGNYAGITRWRSLALRRHRLRVTQADPGDGAQRPLILADCVGRGGGDTLTQVGVSLTGQVRAALAMRAGFR